MVKKILMIVFLLTLAGCNHQEQLGFVDQGTFDRAEYRAGLDSVTIVYWRDGHTLVIGGLKTIPMEKGKEYKVVKAGRKYSFYPIK